MSSKTLEEDDDYRPVYRAIYRRDKDGVWSVTVPQIPGCHAYGPTLAKARAKVHAAVADQLGSNADFEVAETLPLAPVTQTLLADALVRRDLAREQMRHAIARTREAIEALSKEGLSVRDMGSLLGLSHQRVQQLRPQSEATAKAVPVRRRKKVAHPVQETHALPEEADALVSDWSAEAEAHEATPAMHVEAAPIEAAPAPLPVAEEPLFIEPAAEHVFEPEPMLAAAAMAELHPEAEMEPQAEGAFEAPAAFDAPAFDVPAYEAPAFEAEPQAEFAAPAVSDDATWDAAPMAEAESADSDWLDTAAYGQTFAEGMAPAAGWDDVVVDTQAGWEEQAIVEPPMPGAEMYADSAQHADQAAQWDAYGAETVVEAPMYPVADDSADAEYLDEDYVPTFSLPEPGTQHH